MLAAGCGSQAHKEPNRSRVVGEKGVTDGRFLEPRAIAASPDGRIFVVDRTNRVQRLSPGGQPELTWRMPGQGRGVKAPSGICVDPAGRVLVADTHQSQVIAFDRDGRELWRLGERGMSLGQFMLPTDAAVDSKGFIYVSEYGGNDRISKFTPDRRYVCSFGDLSAGSAMLQRPSGLAVDEQDRLWVADTGNHRICCFDSSGRLLSSFGGLGSEPANLRYPRDVALLDDGVLAIVDRGHDRIAFFDRQGRFLGSWGSSGRGFDQVNLPENATTTGRLICVADTRNHRLLFFAGHDWPADTSTVAALAASGSAEGG